MNPKVASLLIGSFVALILTACGSDAQSGGVDDSRGGGWLVFVFFIALAGFFWWWLHESGKQTNLPASTKKPSDSHAGHGHAAAAAPAAKPTQPTTHAQPATPAQTAGVAHKAESSAPAVKISPIASAAAEVKSVVTTAVPVTTPAASNTASSTTASTTEVDVITEDPLRAKRQTEKQKKASKKMADGGDDLTIVEGIGPKISSILHSAGIMTYEALAKADIDTLKKILADNALQYHDPNTWPEQSSLAAKNLWDELEVLQATLSGGKRKV